MEVVLIILLVIVVIFSLKFRSELETTRKTVIDLMNTNSEMKKTVAMGLYYRFSGDKNMELLEQERKRISKSFVKNTPFEFEHFVARVMQDYYGGEAHVTQASSDFGVDIEHKRGNELYLGQVKCYEKDLPFDSIAIIHSQMVKQNATGGFIVTTSSYTENAKLYAIGLSIELIDGSELVELWSKTLEKKKEEVNTIVDPKLV
jgi:restriction system protein